MSLVTNQQHRCRCVAGIRIETSQRDWNYRQYKYTQWFMHLLPFVSMVNFTFTTPTGVRTITYTPLSWKLTRNLSGFWGRNWKKFKQSGCLCVCFLYILFWRPSNKREAALFIDNWPRRGERNKFTRLMRMQMNMLITDV